MPHPIVAIDGPAASGKSSVSRELAKRLNQHHKTKWHWLSTGAFYRAVAYAVINFGEPDSGGEMYTQLLTESQLLKTGGPEAQKLEAKFVYWAQSNIWQVRMQEEQTAVYIQEEEQGGSSPSYRDVSHRLHHQNDLIGSMASKISQWPELRKALLQKQRDCALQGPLIAEGRDCGTVVFPQARYKFYLTATPAQRAQRRSQGSGISVDHMMHIHLKRDERDTQRQAAPLKKAPDAVEVDTSQLPLDQVVEKLYNIIAPH